MSSQITVGIGAVILNEKNEILLVFRRKEPEANKWSIPGGKVDPFERLADSVVREIKEEVNLDVEVGELLCTAETIEPEQNEHYLSLIYSTKNINGLLKNNEPDKLGAVQWFDLSNLPEEIACFSTLAINETKKHYNTVDTSLS